MSVMYRLQHAYQDIAKRVQVKRDELQMPVSAGRTHRASTKRKARVEDEDEDDLNNAEEPKMANEDTDTDPDVVHTPEKEDTTDTDAGDDTTPAKKLQSSPPRSASKAQSRSPQPGVRRNTRHARKPLMSSDDSSDSGFEAAPASQSQPARMKESQGSKNQRKSPPEMPPSEMPPKRELPFGKGRGSETANAPTTTTKPLSQPAPVVDDDEETDDEL